MPKAIRQCTQCGESNHVRRLACSKCDFKFPPKAISEPAKEVHIEKPPAPLPDKKESSGPPPFRDWCGYKIEKIVFIPAGECKVKPEVISGEDSREVVDWAKNVRTEGLTRGLYYTNSALLFYLQQFVEYRSELWNYCEEMVSLFISDPYNDWNAV